LWGTVPDWISACAAVGIVLVAFFQLKGIRTQIKTAQEQVEQGNKLAGEMREAAKIERTLAVCSRYESDVVVERCARILQLAYDQGIYQKNPARYKHETVMLLNFLDTLAIGVEQNLYVDELAKDHMGPIIRYYELRYLNADTLKALDIPKLDYQCLFNLANRWAATGTTYRAAAQLPA